MTLPLSQPWEYQLLHWAQEARQTSALQLAIPDDRDLLETAYHHCETITKFHSKTFFLASGLLPEPKRRAARALYAFCRITDDIVDQPQSVSERQQALNRWRASVTTEPQLDCDLVALAWVDTQHQFQIPSGYAEQLIDGVERDLLQERYQTFNELAGYSYGVASTVGLMAMHIIGFTGEQALPYAVKLGVALQMTNILRDVAQDWRLGRLYLPQEELRQFGLSEEDIEYNVTDRRWRDFMRYQIERTRKLYDESMEGLRYLNPDGRLAIAAAGELYRAILGDIEAHHYDVFSRRAHVSWLGKLARLPWIWYLSRRA